MTSDNRSQARPTEAILLVAGTGSRLLPLTMDRPKCLIDVAGMTLLERLLRQLQSVGITRVVFATGYRHEMLVDVANSWGLELELDAARGDTFETENNAVSLAKAMARLQSQNFLLCDGDILIRDEALLATIMEAPGENVLSMIRFEEMGAEEMKIELHGKSRRIQRLSKGLDPASAHGESLGVQKIGPSAIERLQKRLASMNGEERRRLYYEDIFAELIGQGVPFFAQEFAEGVWTEIDTVEDLESARQMAGMWQVRV